MCYSESVFDLVTDRKQSARVVELDIVGMAEESPHASCYNQMQSSCRGSGNVKDSFAIMMAESGSTFGMYWPVYTDQCCFGCNSYTYC